MKIAVALGADGAVLAHFGQAEKFFIYDDADGIFTLTECRSASPACSRDGSDALMLAVVRQVSDCAAVIAARFGPCALREVENSGVFPFETEGTLDDKLPAGLARMRDYLLGGRLKDRRRSY